MSIAEETKKAERQFLSVLVDYEQKVLELVSKVDKNDRHYVRCRDCEERVSAPIYRNTVQCRECAPPITLNIEQLDSLLEDERVMLFQRLSELDEGFSQQDNIKLRDEILQELQKSQLFVEASVEASESLLPEDDGMLDEAAEFDVKEFDKLIKNLIRVRTTERLAHILGLGSTVTEGVLKVRVAALFGPKPPKMVGVPK